MRNWKVGRFHIWEDPIVHSMKIGTETQHSITQDSTKSEIRTRELVKVQSSDIQFTIHEVNKFFLKVKNIFCVLMHYLKIYLKKKINRKERILFIV